MNNLISARIIADSKNTHGNRLTTFVLVFPRIVLAEFNTHRAISKNSASSRAIPFKTMLEKVMTEPFVPIAFQREHKGMQGTVYFQQTELLEEFWLRGRDAAVEAATDLSNMSVTKQLCNRMLEPYLYHTVICTGSEWENFFALRAHPDAEIHIADLAQKMLDAYNESVPEQLCPGQWHIPFGKGFDMTRLNDLFKVNSTEEQARDTDYYVSQIEALKVKIATARCARVSYLNFEGKDDYAADSRLFEILLTSGHMSPFEHCARAMSEVELDTYTLDVPRTPNNPARLVNREYGVCGNFKGFVQYRKTLENENQSDPRVIKQ